MDGINLMLLCAELVTCTDSSKQYSKMASAWLTAVRSSLFPDFDQGLKAAPTLNKPDAAGFSGIWGNPGSVWASLQVQKKPTFTGGRGTLYSERAWQRMLNSLSDTHPYHVVMEIRPLDNAGTPIGRGMPIVISIDREHDDPEWTRFNVQAPSDLVNWPKSAKIQQIWADFVFTWAGELGAHYGSVAEDTTFETELELATDHYHWETVPRCRDALRGYPWVTVCARELADRLGGAEALEETGAFYRVRKLLNGSVWLQATPTIEEYEGAAVRKVFNALAPVLLTGMVEEPEGGPPWPHLVMGVDATDYQQRHGRED